MTWPDNLYSEVLPRVSTAIRNGSGASDLRQRRIVMVGYELPWDEDRTLIRYGVTFYFEDGFEPGQTEPITRFHGYDLLYANEATPAPRIAAEAPHDSARADASEKPTPIWLKAWYLTGYPFSAAIGIKNVAFEIVKMPFSFIAGRDTLNYPVQNLLNARDALAVELLMPSRRGAEAGLYRLLTETPLIGQAFQYNWGADWSEPDYLSDGARRKLFLSRGKWGQDTGLWAAYAAELYPGYDVYDPPYRHGSVMDVVWSMFNLSHVPGYNEAKYVMAHAASKDRIYLASHSGGVQRSASASRILWHHLRRSALPRAFRVFLSANPAWRPMRTSSRRSGSWPTRSAGCWISPSSCREIRRRQLLPDGQPMPRDGLRRGRPHWVYERRDRRDGTETLEPAPDALASLPRPSIAQR